jgi:hypothetical protein
MHTEMPGHGVTSPETEPSHSCRPFLRKKSNAGAARRNAKTQLQKCELNRVRSEAGNENRELRTKNCELRTASYEPRTATISALRRHFRGIRTSCIRGKVSLEGSIFFSFFDCIPVFPVSDAVSDV